MSPVLWFTFFVNPFETILGCVVAILALDCLSEIVLQNPTPAPTEHCSGDLGRLGFVPRT